MMIGYAATDRARLDAQIVAFANRGRPARTGDDWPAHVARRRRRKRRRSSMRRRTAVTSDLAL
jgi:hypothetical protein